MNSQLTTENSTTHQNTRRELVESFRQMVLEKTDGGSLIIQFLVSAVKGEHQDFQPCHKLEAARLLQKLTGAQVHAFIDSLPEFGMENQPATRRERRDGRRADRRISSELARIAQEETNNGRTVVEFLVSAMEGELQDFKPCHRMSASKELLRCVFDFVEEEEEIEAEPALDPAEEEERLRQEEYERQRAEATEFSLHGPVYYETYPWPCPCEDRWHDCDGNELTDEESEQAAREPPGTIYILRSKDTPEAFKARYEAYLTRLNPDTGKELFSIIRWPTPKPKSLPP